MSLPKESNLLSDKHKNIFAWVTVIYAVLNLFSMVVMFTQNTSAFNLGWILVVLVNFFGIYAAISLMKKKDLSIKLLPFFWGSQIVGATTKHFTFSLISGVNFGITHSSPNAAVQINILALCLFIITLRMLREHKHLTRVSN